MNSNLILKVENQINYTFKDKCLLIKALTHSSFDSIENNEFLEYLGDSLLDFLVAEYLYMNNPNMKEGRATKLRSQIVSRWPLAKLFDKFNLISIIRFQNINIKNLSVKFKSNFVESILGAVFVDGGIDEARKFVVTFLCSDNSLYDEDVDFKSKLFEYCAKNCLKITFNDYSKGLQHKQHFYSIVYVDGVEMGRGEGSTKRSAEQQACKMALEKIKCTL